jgi:amino acid transporter
MEAIGQLLAAIVTFLLEVTFHALVFVFHFLMAMFNPRYRDKLQEDWNTSAWKRFNIALGVTMYTAAFIIALIFWIPTLLRRPPEVVTQDKKPTITIEFSSEETQQIKNTKKIEELVDVAGGIIKRKIAEREEEAQQAAPRNR